MLDKQRFYEHIRRKIKDHLPSSFADAEVRLKHVLKNNVERTGLIIHRGQDTASPIIYLDGYYEDYLKGRKLNDIMTDIRFQSRQELSPDILSLVRRAGDYDIAKEDLQICLCDPEQNREWLKDRVYTRAGDFAAVYQINIAEDEHGIMNIPVTRDLMNMWGISEEILHRDALAADRNRRPLFINLKNLIGHMTFGLEKENLLELNEIPKEYEDFPVFCLTNESGMNGAGLILDDGLMEKIGKMIGHDYYILPSSIHEVMIVPDDGKVRLDELSGMVREANQKAVGPEELLSYSVQYYDRAQGRFYNAGTHDREKTLHNVKHDIGQEIHKTGDLPQDEKLKTSAGLENDKVKDTTAPGRMERLEHPKLGPSAEEGMEFEADME